jgi:hypothetical protein
MVILSSIIENINKIILQEKNKKIFEENELSIEDLNMINKQELKEIGINLGDRNKILYFLNLEKNILNNNSNSNSNSNLNNNSNSNSNLNNNNNNNVNNSNSKNINTQTTTNIYNNIIKKIKTNLKIKNKIKENNILYNEDLLIFLKKISKEIYYNNFLENGIKTLFDLDLLNKNEFNEIGKYISY